MKKWQFITLIILGSLFGVYQILSFTGLLAVFKNATWANEPNIKEGQIIMTTNLLSPRPGDFVCYKFKYPDSLDSHYRIHRLVALENDILEIREGVLFVNGKNFDKNHSLAHEYKISIEELKKFDIERNEVEENYWWMKPQDTLAKFIDDRVAEKFNLKERRVTKVKGESNKMIKTMYDKEWNKDNFGPFKIPSGKVFIMGDNRDQSEDSRFIGPIDESALKGVLIR